MFCVFLGWSWFSSDYHRISSTGLGGVVDKPSARRVSKTYSSHGRVAIFFGLPLPHAGALWHMKVIAQHAEITLSSPPNTLNVNFWVGGAAFAVIFLTDCLTTFFSQAYSNSLVR